MEFIRKGLVFDIKRSAIDDGPGIRTTVFLKGCPLRCWWCHNPEGQSSKPELMYRLTRCKSSAECLNSCAKAAISKKGDHVSIDRNKCELCGKCAEACPSEALEIIGRETTVEHVLRELEKDLPFYDESCGGATFSGGEPLMQPDFLEVILQECRKRNIRTALDTCGFAPWETIERIVEYVDLFLYDVKSMDDAIHKKYTGVSNKLILQNLRRLADSGRRISIRFPVIPTINDDARNISALGDFATSNDIKQVCLLPYHRAGIEKYRSLDKTYQLEKLDSPSNEKMNMIKEKLITFGLEVKVGGG